MKLVSTKGILLRLSALYFIVYVASAQNSTSNSNGSANNGSQVPVLSLAQIAKIVNITDRTSENADNVAPITRPTTQSVPTTTTTRATTTTASTTTPTTTTTAKATTPSTTTTTTTTTQPPTTTTTTTQPTTTTTTTTTTQPPTTTTTKPPTTTQKATTTPAPPSPATQPPSVIPPQALGAPEALKVKPETTTERVTTTTTTTEAPKLSSIVVKVSSGELRPLEVKSRGGRKYYAFRGIPYALPPTQFQRFKEPGPFGEWEGVLNATEYGPTCIQYNIISEKVEGEEDCLHLNIFTPKIQAGRNKNQNGRFPVMVFFHQGAFMFGTSKDFQEKYMMDEDVVLVTVNYRVGAFGFLNTQGDSDAKGNMGLKDQVIALKFVQNNIHHFNGDKNLVTIFGESAGGASVHYHLLSDRSKGLFSRAISMSGVALNPWGFIRSPRKMAKKLGTLLNCPTSDMNELFTCLQGHEAIAIAAKTTDLYEWNTDPITPFGPSVEVEETLSSFLTQTPYNLMKSGHISDVPWMVGVVENVCLLDAWSVLKEKQFVEDMNVDWHRIAPTTFMFRETALEPDAVSNQIRAYYFGTKEVGNDTASNLTNLYSDRYFNHGIRTSALLHVQTNEATPVYLYVFSYKGSQSHTSFAGITDILGVSEGDELRFLFNTGRFDDIPLNSADGDISSKFIKLWVSFARDGRPTAVWGNEEWKRVSSDQVKGDDAVKYYSLNQKCGFVEEPFSARMNFWDTLPLNENDNELLSPYLQRGSSSDDDDFFGSFSNF